ncbi:MAG: alanine racemase [Actinomycetota bacterium]|nr:alanine racemase [Actinomycetota bacterium]
MNKDPIIDKRFAWAEINLSRLCHNLEIIQSFADSKNTKVMAVVKADAYGHGAAEVSRQALKCGAYSLGVAIAEEGIELRASGITAPIYILGESPPEAMEEAIKYDLILNMNSYKAAQFVSEECERTGKKVTVSINIDTGMNRIGINFNDAVSEILKISSLPNLKLEAISTHFSCAGGRDDYYTEQQWKRFNEIINRVKDKKINIKIFHCANSAVFFRHRNMHLDMVRTGISIYGLNPYDEDYADWLDPEASSAVSRLKPVFSLKTRITFIKEVPSGELISYCGTFRTKRDSIIATVPVGYADGYPRSLANRAVVLIDGKPAPVVGNITMDQFMIDITDIAKESNINAGDEVILIGDSGDKKITADDIARLMDTINYEVVCMFKKRIPRIYIR